VGGNNAEALPPTRSQEKKWTKAIRDRLGQWVLESAHPLIQRALQEEHLPAIASIEPGKSHVIRIDYEHVAEGSGYVKPVVILEFGARSTGEPCAPIDVRCDAAEFLPTLSFPVCTPRVMGVERTFWEKATAVHVYCLGGNLRGSRFSRHWYDLVQLDSRGHAAAALKRRDVADQVARHKTLYFPEKNGNSEAVDYSRAVAGALCLVPPAGPLLDALTMDYGQMLEDGLLRDPASPFEEVVRACRELEVRVNVAMRR
jgi:hypothetical protein